MEIKAQLKIQEMAFVLVAIMIFFALLALVFFSVKMGSYKETAANLQEEQASLLVRHISGIPELSWGCPGCIDMDKALALSISNHQDFARSIELDYLMLESLYPDSNPRECNLAVYPDCSKITIISSSNSSFGTASSAFVNLCRWNSEKKQIVCSLGRVYASGGFNGV